ncbi:MAG: hypothetical protein VCE12_09875 [Candidatus Latescibacterota bacterium]
MFDNDVVAESIRAELRSLHEERGVSSGTPAAGRGAWLNPRDRDDQMRRLQSLEERMDVATKLATGILESLGHLQQPAPTIVRDDDPETWMRTAMAWRLESMIPALGLVEIREIVESVQAEVTQDYEDKRRGIQQRTPKSQGNETAFRCLLQGLTDLYGCISSGIARVGTYLESTRGTIRTDWR